MNTTAKGAYRIEVYEGDQLIEDTGEFDNLITDLALLEGDPFNAGVMCIGTGKTTPLATDVSLESEVAAKSCVFNQNATIHTKEGVRYAKRSATSSFSGVSGDISEVGFRGSDANSVRSRSLIRDGNGLVTVIPVTPVQTIKISYFVYVLIPDVLATGAVTTPYGSSEFAIKPHPDLLQPEGIFAGFFSSPFAGRPLQANLTNGSINADVFSWSYDVATLTATASVVYNAIDSNRTITGFRASSNHTNLPIIELSTPLINPAQNDCTFTMTFTWGRA